MPASSYDTRLPDSRQPHSWLGWLAAGVHLAIGVFPLSASGLLAPPWALATLAAAWIVGLLAILRVKRAHPAMAVLIPLSMLAFWFALLTFGERALGWVG